MDDARAAGGARAPGRDRVLRLQAGGLVLAVGALGVLGYRDLRHRCAAPAPVRVLPTAPPTTKEVFESVYRNHNWGVNAEGVGRSGFGSTMEFTRLYRVWLQDFLAEHGIRSVVDAGCGDWEFSRAIDWSGIEYLGCDIVESVIETNRERYAAPNIRFVACDIVRTDLPAADLLIVKDVLQHLPNRDIAQFLDQLPKYRHVVIVNDVDPATFSATNPDIPAGHHRPLDLTRPPFEVPMTRVFAWHHGGFTKLVLHLGGD